VLAYYTETYSASDVASALAERFPEAARFGCSSCQGVMTDRGYHGVDGTGFAILTVTDPEGVYGVGLAQVGDRDPAEAAAEAVEAAMASALRFGETPALVWLHASPGTEERAIEGVQQVLGDNIVISGGSAADNTVAGDWSLFAGDETAENAVGVALLYPPGVVSHSFHMGYEPTEKTGTVTKVDGRMLVTIDDRPAAEVYNEWTGGLVADEMAEGGNVLGKTTISPLGRPMGDVRGIAQYNLVHPDQVTATGGLSLFAEVAKGEQLTLMSGSLDSLISRAGRVAAATLTSNTRAELAPVGCLAIYCAGCMLTVGDAMPQVVESVRDGLPEGTPFIGAFTFGEQGCFLGGENRHGNLMIAMATVFA
jgi:hypothetical protein